MNINWHGQSFFEISLKGLEGSLVKIAIDPFGPELGLKVPRLEADILLITHQHPDHNNQQVFKNRPFLIDSPGEYELKGVFIQGLKAFHDQSEGADRGEVVVYKIEAEEMTLVHLSDLGQKELTEEQLEGLGEVDVLFAPVGGVYTIDAKGAAEIISQLEPRLVIPMHYKIPGLKIELDGVDKFLKQMGAEEAQRENKLKISLKDLPQEETKIIVLES